MASEAASANFIHAIAPLIAARNYAALADTLRTQWPPQRLAGFLSSASGEAVKAAVFCLGFAGSMGDCPDLAAMLRHNDASVARLAEDSLWSIWMRAGSKTGNCRLADAIHRIKLEDYGAAEQRLRALQRSEPMFAEPHHQRGIALSMLDRVDEAAQEYRAAFDLNPYHFSAVAALGHTHAQRGNVVSALICYRQALEIHPRLDGLPETVAMIERALDRRATAS